MTNHQPALLAASSGRNAGDEGVQAIASNRRRHSRYACEGDAEVFVSHGALLFRGAISDLSISGCFIETPSLKLERGTAVEVSFVARRMRFRVAGHIASLHRRCGAGIAFHAMSPRRLRQIEELVRELEEALAAKDASRMSVDGAEPGKAKARMVECGPGELKCNGDAAELGAVS